MYEEKNYLSFYARIKTKTVLDSFKDSLQTYGSFFFNFLFHFLLKWDLDGWLNYFSFPYKISGGKKTKKKIEKTDRTFVRNLSRIPKLSLFLF